MILYKTIAMQYGHYLATGRYDDKHDPVGRMAPTEETRAWRQGVLHDIAAARIYLLDHRAANYLDSLRGDVQDGQQADQQEIHIRNYVREVDFPRDLVWVEYDSRKLWEDRIARSLVTMSDEELGNWLQRGFLFDNRSPDTMTVRLFSAVTDRDFMDPPLTLMLRKSQDGHPDFDSAEWQPHTNVVSVHLQLFSGGQQQVRDLLKEHRGHLSYEMVMGFMLFAALATREDDRLLHEVSSLSTAQAKTARKFGKIWMTETLRTHVTVRIGPVGESHRARGATGVRKGSGLPPGIAHGTLGCRARKTLREWQGGAGPRAQARSTSGQEVACACVGAAVREVIGVLSRATLIHVLFVGVWFRRLWVISL